MAGTTTHTRVVLPRISTTYHEHILGVTKDGVIKEDAKEHETKRD